MAADVPGRSILDREIYVSPPRRPTHDLGALRPYIAEPSATDRWRLRWTQEWGQGDRRTCLPSRWRGLSALGPMTEGGMSPMANQCSDWVPAYRVILEILEMRITLSRCKKGGSPDGTRN